jgi:hypothetical protein
MHRYHIPEVSRRTGEVRPIPHSDNTVQQLVEPSYPVDESPREFAKEVSIVPSCMYEKNTCKRHAKTRYLERMLPE